MHLTESSPSHKTPDNVIKGKENKKAPRPAEFSGQLQMVKMP